MRGMDDVKVIKRSGGGCAKEVNENETGERKGPWTLEEDTILVNYVNTHGEGHWNTVARCAGGLRRSGKSCRLRWLNYLRPDVRRGNITLEEQILILDLHSRWGNRWSKIAEHLPGRTDNEIKNYWRTRVMKLAKQLKCDVNSKEFRDALRCVWIPRLLERVQLKAQSFHPNPNVPEVLLHQNGLHGSVSSGTELAKQNHFSCASASASASGSSPDSSVEFPVPSNADLNDSLELLVHENKGSELCPIGLNNQREQGNGGGDSLDILWNDESSSSSSIWFLQQLSDDDLQIKYNFLV